MASGGIDSNELRRRLLQEPAHVHQANSVEVARDVVAELNDNESKSGKDINERHTYGRTPDGTVFVVPPTSSVLSHRQPKDLGIAIFISVAHMLTFLFLPSNIRVATFAIIFLFWRACYNVGIGSLLRLQSNHKTVVSWVKKSNILVDPASGKNPHPFVYKFLKRELESKICRGYQFDKAPIEYNTWLIWREAVDLILISDVVSYCLFGLACCRIPDGEHVAVTALRWVAGAFITLFSLWGKVDANRVLTDYAWYWGDFFFLIDRGLTFEGVFEMFPHPMYTLGYIWFYAVSLMAASYKVLFISIIAHAMMFGFLSWVEDPHIDKTYNQSPPTKHVVTSPGQSQATMSSLQESGLSMSVSTSTYNFISQLDAPRALLGLKNFDLYRVTDTSTILIQMYCFSLAIFTPSTTMYRALFVAHALAWRLWFSFGIGFILDRQSKKKKWTRHFIKYGESTKEAWRQWRSLYHISMTMCYTSFVIAAFKMYHLPPNWTYGMATLRHVLGTALIALHVWTVSSIYTSLGEFGFFYGDFFADRPQKLTYVGIYRYLNNPERIIGLAGVWGVAIITWSRAIFFLALVSQVLTLCLIQFVETPHMEKLYGKNIRQASGVSKSIRRSLPPTLQQWSSKVDRIFDESLDFIEEFIDSIQPKLAAGVDNFVKDYKDLLHKYNALVSLTRLASSSIRVNSSNYALDILIPPSDLDAKNDFSKTGNISTPNSPPTEANFQPLVFDYGAPIRVRWTAPVERTKRDWVGLYRITDNASRLVTAVSSQGRWIATCKGDYLSESAEQGIVSSNDMQNITNYDGSNETCTIGVMEFSKEKLFWKTGVFEFRYHSDSKHQVMAISQPFEISIDRFDEDDAMPAANNSLRGAVENALLPMVQNCLDRDPELAPRTVDETFGELVKRESTYAKRIVYAVRSMFGIEFAAEVISADGNVRNLAWRICNAKAVLVPYSMTSPLKGVMTPTEIND